MARKRSGFFPGVSLILLTLWGAFTSSVQALTSELGSEDKTVLSAQQAVPVYGQVPNLLQQGRQLYEAGRFSEAAAVFQREARAFATQGDRLQQAIALSNFSLAAQQLGQWPQATQALSQSLQLLQAGQRQRASRDQLQALAQTLDIKGRSQLVTGQAEQALNTWQQSTNTYTQLDDATGVIRSQINQAQALQALGFYRRALTRLMQVKQTLQDQPASHTKATGLRSLGNTLRVVGDLDQSQQVLQQSLVTAQQLQSSQDISAAYLSLGNTERALGNRAREQQDTASEESAPWECRNEPSNGRVLSFYQQAKKSYQEAAAIASAAPMTRVQAQLNHLSVLLETQQGSGARALWLQIQPQITNLPRSRAGVYARINVARNLACLNQTTTKGTPSQPEIAQLLATAVQQAKGLGDQRAEAYALGSLGELYGQAQQWSEAQALTQQALLLAQAAKASDITYQWQWQLGRLLKVQGDTRGAISAYTEAVNTLRSLRSDLVAVNPEVQFSFRDEVEPVYRQLVGLLLQSNGSTEPSQESLSKARTVIESLQLAELENFFRQACLDTNPVLVDQVIDRENPTAAVIYPIILADRLEVILKLPQQPLRRYVTRLPQSQVEITLDRLSQSLRQRNSQEVVPLSQKVFDWLIRPAETDLNKSGIKTLVFVLDGPLRNIPMATLHDGQKYLVEKEYSVALTPGLQLLKPQPLERGQLRTLVAGLTESHQGFPALNYVTHEFDQIQSEVPGRELLNQEFTNTNLQNAINSAPFPVVHLATHGQFSSQATETFVLTWNDRININQLGNLLRARDQSRPDAVKGRSKTIELLVLSACETATGDRRAALGLAGVAVRAGARSTLATLWQVNDEATASLMGQFYQELANPELTKAEALRRAQLALLKERQYQHPYFWAPYVLLGNWL
jgi:CHAT domain-containing protein